jgi:hypothetical protein
MSRSKALLALGLTMVFSPGCYYFRSPVLYPPPIGSGFTGIGVPVDTTFDMTEIQGRQGSAKSRCVFGMFSWGDATVDSAARRAGIQVVEHIDCKINVILLGMYSEYETVVTGH